MALVTVNHRVNGLSCSQCHPGRRTHINKALPRCKNQLTTIFIYDIIRHCYRALLNVRVINLWASLFFLVFVSYTINITK